MKENSFNDKQEILDDKSSSGIKEYYFEHNIKDDKYDKSLKVILLGDPMVGKSSIIQRICKGVFADNLSPTISIEYHNYSIKINNEYTVRLKIWDTAGQEKFNSIVKNYYQSTDFGIYIYSIDDLQSFERIKDFLYEAQENNQKNDNNNLVKNILLGNKKDLESNRKISYFQGEKFANENKFLIFKEISCKSDEEKEVNNILEVFEEIAKYTYLNRGSTIDSDSMNYVASNSMIEISKTNKIKNKQKNKKKCC